MDDSTRGSGANAITRVKADTYRVQTQLLESYKTLLRLYWDPSWIRQSVRLKQAWEDLADFVTREEIDPHEYVMYCFDRVGVPLKRPVFETDITCLDRVYDFQGSRAQRRAYIEKVVYTQYRYVQSHVMERGESLEATLGDPRAPLSVVFRFAAAVAWCPELAQRFEEDALFMLKYDPAYEAILARMIANEEKPYATVVGGGSE